MHRRARCLDVSRSCHDVFVMIAAPVSALSEMRPSAGMGAGVQFGLKERRCNQSFQPLEATGRIKSDQGNGLPDAGIVSNLRKCPEAFLPRPFNRSFGPILKATKTLKGELS